MRLADHDHAGGNQAPRQRGRPFRPAVPPDRAAAGGDLAFDLHQVLQRDGDAVQRPDRMAGADGLVGGLGRQVGIRGIDIDEGLQLRLQPFDAREAILDEFDRRKPAGGDPAGDDMDRKPGRRGRCPAHPMFLKQVAG
ncbi:hypothetical protein KSF81_22160 [Siccirubricoccus sp. G192]|nr:hypothetical protein [Siccirubricoccus sp. G192]MBV1799527.1 hypothetical protein [Siccirubricoccus sp. G192]